MDFVEDPDFPSFEEQREVLLAAAALGDALEAVASDPAVVAASKLF